MYAVLLVMLAPAPFLKDRPPDVVGDYVYASETFDFHHAMYLERNGKVVAHRIGFSKNDDFYGRWRLKKLGATGSSTSRRPSTLPGATRRWRYECPSRSL